jgi:hypothetical protein
MGCPGLDLSGSEQKPEVVPCELGDELKGSIKDEELLE